MDIAARNRAIKKTLEAIFGRGKVSVRGSRGTSYGWVTVEINWTPLDNEHSQEMAGKCKQLLRAAKIDLGFTYTDDTCQSTSDRCHINFNPARYYRTHRQSDGRLAVLCRFGDTEWQTVAA